MCFTGVLLNCRNNKRADYYRGIVRLAWSIKAPDTNDDHYYCLILYSVPVYCASELLVEPFRFKMPIT